MNRHKVVLDNGSDTKVRYVCGYLILKYCVLQNMCLKADSNDFSCQSELQK